MCVCVCFLETDNLRLAIYVRGTGPQSWDPYIPIVYPGKP